jgi:hypothetical protein
MALRCRGKRGGAAVPGSTGSFRLFWKVSRLRAQARLSLHFRSDAVALRAARNSESALQSGHVRESASARPVL